jgi:pilus assembly protein Flp/PilA
MQNIAQRLARFLASEDGPTAVEYAIMLALIIVTCITTIGTIGTNSSNTFVKTGNAARSTGS